jgi:hypothetical protein
MAVSAAVERAIPSTRLAHARIESPPGAGMPWNSGRLVMRPPKLGWNDVALKTSLIKPPSSVIPTTVATD